jgi:mRNA (2'-O-methyladenosine-N6-)-methyltransferase
LEVQFFLEEDSDREENLKSITNVSKHEEALHAFKEIASVKNFWCIPLSVDVRTFNFRKMAEAQTEFGGRPFDIVTCDPPWQLSSANPTRGVAISYDTLSDAEVLALPFDVLQPQEGFLFVWVINAKYRFALQMMKQYGYRLVDEICWVKQTVNGKIAKGHGYYLQHAKELCLVGFKGNPLEM